MCFGGCPSHGDTARLGTPNPAQRDLDQPQSRCWGSVRAASLGSLLQQVWGSPTARPVHRGFVASRGSHFVLLLLLPHPRLQRGQLCSQGLGLVLNPPCPLCRAAWGAKWAFTAWAGAAAEGEVPKLTRNTWNFIKKQQKNPNKTNIFAPTAKPTNNFQPQSIFPWWEQLMLGSWGGGSWHPHHEP